MTLICGFCMELGKAGADTASALDLVRVRGRGERERSKRWSREGLSTVAARAGGPARSSGEAPVMGVERRGWLIRGRHARPTGVELGGVA